MSIPATVLVFIIAIPLFTCMSFRSGNRKVIEIGNTVGLRPETHLARLVKCRIFDVEQALLVQKDREYGVVEINHERVPLSAWNLMFHSVSSGWQPSRSNRGSNALFDLIKHDIVFQRIRADNVVVFRILVAPDNPGGPIDRTVNRLESHADLAVASRNSVPDG